MTPIVHITDKEAALMRENERLTDKVKRQSATIHVQAVAIQALQDDAERYRWLRKMHDICDDEITLWHVRGDDGQPVNVGRLDTAIDNARKEQS